jgi:hypothetical protein
MAKRGPHQTLIQQSRKVPPSEKAAFHQITGAGKSRVLRKFFGLNDSDEAAIVAKVRDGLAQALRG